MAKNRYYTLLLVPEKTSQVRRLVIPAWIARGAAMVFALLGLLAAVMLFDYWQVMNQIHENKQLRMENRRLRQQVQVFRNKITTIESTMDRIRTFATRLKVITNIEDRGSLLESANTQLPDAATNLTGAGFSPVSTQPVTATAPAAVSSPIPAPLPAPLAVSPEVQPSPLAAGGAPAPEPPTPASSTLSAEEQVLRKDADELDLRFSGLYHETLYVEQLLQDQYELLADQKSFLLALPTRKPVVGYFTSGFGIRRSPYGGRVKMHEGLDIANRPGTLIRAPADAQVLFSDTKAGYGQTVILDHGYGLETWYGHTRKLLVKKGQKVKRGDVIAQLGNSGRSTGPHLHYEVRIRGFPVDPLSYILEN